MDGKNHQMFKEISDTESQRPVKKIGKKKNPKRNLGRTDYAGRQNLKEKVKNKCTHVIPLEKYGIPFIT